MFRFRGAAFIGLLAVGHASELQTQLQQALAGLTQTGQPATASNCTSSPKGFSIPTNGGCASDTCDGDFEWQEWITAHNLYRCMHGIPPVSWNKDMYIKVSWEFYNNPDLHRTKSYILEPPIGPAGENAARSSIPATPFQIVSAWYSQIQHCSGFPGCSPKPGTRTRAFTTMIWQGVKEIGCFRNAQNVAACWYKGSDTPSCETPNFGRPEVEYQENVFQNMWSLDYCVQGFKSAQIAVPDVSGVDGITGLVLETPGLSFQDESAFTGNALIAMVLVGIGCVSMVTVAVVRRRKANAPQLEHLVQDE